MPDLMPNELISKSKVIAIINNQIEEDIFQESYCDLRDCKRAIEELPAEAVMPKDAQSNDFPKMSAFQFAEYVVDCCRKAEISASDIDNLITVLRWEKRHWSRSEV